MTDTHAVIGRHVTLELVDTADLARVPALVWAISEPDETTHGLDFLRRRYGVRDPSARATIYALIEGGLVVRGELNPVTLEGFGVVVAQSRDELAMPDVTHGPPPSMPPFYPL
jgi:hypothetical protein